MLNKFFQKIDKIKYPKTVRHWSFSVIFVYPAFVIANKLWQFLYAYLILTAINFIFLFSGLDIYVVNLISIFVFAVLLFLTFYLVIYGRALAWQKLGYQDTPLDIAKFKFRQRIVLYINVIVIGLIIILILAGLEYGHQLSLLGD